MSTRRFALLAVLGLAATFPAGATAEPLVEIELNNNALYANGPVPADGSRDDRGRVTSGQTACNRGLAVTLLRRGKGTRSYASVAGRTVGTLRCSADISNALRKRH